MNYLFRLISALVITLLSVPTSLASADTTIANTQPVISEIQTASAISASQEFVELYNPGIADVSVAGWTLEYHSANGDPSSGWIVKATLSGMIKGHSFLLIAPKAYLSGADGEWGATLAAAGGAIRLKSDTGTVFDQVGYGTAVIFAEGGRSAIAPAAGQSIERMPGRLTEFGGNAIDSDQNTNDFLLRTQSQPQSSQAAVEVPIYEITDEPVEAEQPPETEVVTPETFALIEITELLPDPEIPLTDADNEYVELFNPNDEPVLLKGYVIRWGTAYKSAYTLGDSTIAPKSYMTLSSKDSDISLSNSGTSLQLIDPAGAVIATVPNYGVAKSGQSWSLDGDEWRWSLQTTPGKDNIIAALSAASPAIKSVGAKKKKAATTVKKPKAASVKKAKAPKAKKVKKVKPTLAIPTQVAGVKNFTPATWLLIVLAAITIGYAAYEFRYDLRRLYAFTRRNSSGRNQSSGFDNGRKYH